MAPIPIALYAVQLEMARKVKEAMLPEYDGEFPLPRSPFPGAYQHQTNTTQSCTSS